MLATRTCSDLLVVDADGLFEANELLDVVAAAATPHTAGLVVSMLGAEDCVEAQLDALIALKKKSLRTWGHVLVVAAASFGEDVRRRIGPWLTVLPSESDAARRLWPELGQSCTWLVGYWTSAFLPHRNPSGAADALPDPRRLVDPAWRPGQRERIARYLDAGRVVAHWCGLSPCRFGCGSYGSTCLSDGHWQWPEGLVHYVECHDVRLPDEFVDTMEGNGWSVPGDAGTRLKSPSFQFWIEWASRQGAVAAEYGECVALAGDVRRAFCGDGFPSLLGLDPPGARTLRDLLRMAGRLGDGAAPSADELRLLMTGARRALGIAAVPTSGPAAP